MVDFKVFVDRFGKLKGFIKKTTNEIILELGDTIVKLQVEQHQRGVNITGEKMQTGYSPAYGKKRKRKGLQIGFVDLRFSGRMEDNYKVKPVKEGVDIESNVDYEKYVRGNFPGEAGLTEENAERMANKIADKLAPRIKKQLVG